MTALYAPSFRWAFLVLLGMLTFSPIVSSAGMAPDEVKAFEACKAEAEKGNALFQGLLGVRYLHGNGVQKDTLLAVNWFKAGAIQGDGPSQMFLADCYALGEGVLKNEVEAYAYYNLASMSYLSATGANDYPRKELAKLEAKISRDEIAAGQRRAVELMDEQRKAANKNTTLTRLTNSLLKNGWNFAFGFLLIGLIFGGFLGMTAKRKD